MNDDSTYNLLVENEVTKYQANFNKLTQKNVEKMVNGLSNMANYVYVKKIGKEIPKEVSNIRLKPERVTFTTFHNPRIITPLLRFCYLVKSKSVDKFEDLAQELQEFGTKVIESYDNLWNEKGYFTIEKRISFL